MLTILLDGVAYGMLLFVLASGLSVTLGLMNFINLAHGAFAMIGGYVTALLMNRAGAPFLATLPAAFLIPAILGVALERTLYRRLYGASPLDQVLFTIGLVLMAMPIAAYLIGDEPQQVHLPAWLSGRIEVHGVGIGVYRLFIIAVCGAIAAATANVPDQDPVRRAAEGGGRRRARRSGFGHQCRSHLRPRLRGRKRARGLRRSAWPPMSSAASILRSRLNFW